MKLILASKSKERQRMFSYLGVSFEVDVSSVDERTIVEENPIKLVEKLAELKADAIAEKHNDAIVVGGDTVGIFEGSLLHKPKTIDEARKILKSLSNNTHSFVSGFCVINTKTGDKRTGHGTCEITFRDLSDTEIERFIATGRPLELAGGYQIIGDVSELFIAKMNGSHSVCNGIAMDKIIPILQEFGLDV
jgi:septum formation protein